MLGELGVHVAERRLFADLPTEDEIRRLANLLPGGVYDLVSTRSRRFKELGLAEKQLTEDEWVALLSREPGLWRRPIAVKGRQVAIGWDEQALRELLS